MKRIEAVGRKKWRERCRLLLLGAAALLCFSKAVRHEEALKAQASDLDFTVSGREGALDYAGAMSVREANQKREYPLEYVNWTQTDGVQVSAPGLGTAEACSVLFVLGRSDLLFSGCAVLDAQSRHGCLLSAGLSGRLFGGKDTKGLTVEVQGRELEVLDVVDSEEAFLVCEAEENDACSFDRTTVRCISGAIGKTEEGYQQLCGGWERMETRVPVWAAQGACFLVPCILWGFLLYYCAKMSRSARGAKPAGGREGQAAGRTGRIEKMIWTSMLYLLLAGGILLLIRVVRIPEDMIPARWSDFGFWEEYGKKLAVSCQALIRSGKKIPDIPAMKEFVKALQWAMAAVAAEIVFLYRFWKT